jgi:hypothetical protein
MANINDVYKSTGSSLVAADLKGNTVELEISAEETKTFERDGGGKDHKIILSFVGKEKTLVVNKTNAATIAEMHGSDSEGWVGKKIKVYPTKVDFSGKMVDAIRVLLPPPPEASGDDEEIPF